MPKFTENLLNIKRRTVKLIVSLLTGHSRLKKHIGRLNQPQHIFSQCKELARLMLECSGKPYPHTASYMKTIPPKLGKLKQKVKQDQGPLGNRSPQ